MSPIQTTDPDATITLHCPRMKIDRVSGRLRRTHAEPMLGRLVVGGSSLMIPDITIPPTEVDKVGPFKWRVRPCQGSYTSQSGPVRFVVVSLPEEPVLLEVDSAGVLTMVAIAIMASCRVELDDGRILATLGTDQSGWVRFPDCPTDNPLLDPVAQACDTTGGKLYFQ